MRNNVLNISEKFRKMAVRSVVSIVLFLFTYILLIILGIGLIALCGLIAVGLLEMKVMFLTVLLGLGFIGMGLMIFLFLIKFIFSSPKKVDRSHLIELKEEEQPALFRLIYGVVNEVKTDFPKKVYLSSDVNASVFYDSNFWSMFFPVRKNLQIGLGLMNAVTVIEFKAIIAHEFGHFSQRSMKVGSYVYNVNKVIYNMLYDNDTYGSFLERWSGMSSYFSIFAKGAVMVIRGIQYVLVKVYKILNLNYMALSREMEFHADAVAASVTGSSPLTRSLLRIGLADQSLSIVFNYYDRKIETAQKTNNFYPQHSFILSRLAQVEKLSFIEGLPNLSIEDYKRFNKTKLVLDNQWSSHPSTEERVSKLMALDQPEDNKDKGLAMDLLTGQEQLQEIMTSRIFETVSYNSEPTILRSDDFTDEYLRLEKENSYHEVYNGYFNGRNPYAAFTSADFETYQVTAVGSARELFSECILGEVRSLETAMSDMGTLDRINKNELDIHTFDYDGQKYTTDDVYPLIKHLEAEIDRLKKQLDEKEIQMFRFFLNKAFTKGSINEFKDLSMAFQEVDYIFKESQRTYVDLVEASYFMQTSMAVESIAEKVYQLKKTEEPFKEMLKALLDHVFYKGLIEEKVRVRFEEYLAKDREYFEYDQYYEQEVAILYEAMAGFSALIYDAHFKTKKALLEFQAILIDETLTTA